MGVVDELLSPAAPDSPAARRTAPRPATMFGVAVLGLVLGAGALVLALSRHDAWMLIWPVLFVAQAGWATLVGVRGRRAGRSRG